MIGVGSVLELWKTAKPCQASAVHIFYLEQEQGAGEDRRMIGPFHVFKTAVSWDARMKENVS